MRDLGEKPIALRAPQRLEIALAGAGSEARQVDFFQVKRQLELCRQLGDKACVPLRIFAPQPVLQVRDFEMQIEIPAQPVQQMQQRHRIRPAGNRCEHPVAGGEQIALADRTAKFLPRFHSAQMFNFPA